MTKWIIPILVYTCSSLHALAQFMPMQPRKLTEGELNFNNISRQKFNCVWGNCDNGTGRLFATTIYKKKANRADVYYSIEGNFKNGRLNGFGKTTAYYGTEPPVKKGAAFDSLTAVNEVYNSLYSDTYEGAFGYYKDGYLQYGTHIDFNKTTWSGMYENTWFVYGSIKEKNAEVEYKGFQCGKHVYSNWYANGCPFTGLRMRIKKDSAEMIPYQNFEKTNLFKPFAPSEYVADRKTVNNMPFEEGIYNGETAAGLPEGLGEWISNDHRYVHFGYFKKGKLHGLAALNFNMNNKNEGPLNFGYLVGLFKNGIIQYASVSTFSKIYTGEVNNNYEPNGYGYWDDKGMQLTHEDGLFSNGQLHGPGTRRYTDGKALTGNFSYGTFTSGTIVYTINSLRKGDVVKVNGKKYAVIDNPWDENDMFQKNRGWVTLSDRSQLKEGTNFEKLNESNSAFYKTCDKCYGKGNIETYSPVKVLVSAGKYSTYQQYTGPNTQPVQVTVALADPVYETKLTSQYSICPVCNGTGKVLR